jgi:nitroreductase
MEVEEAIRRRRSTRIFNKEYKIPISEVKECLALSHLAPNSSNMQLWEFYHINDPEAMERLASACLGQSAVVTAEQAVVFVARQDLYKKRSQALLRMELEDIELHTPEDRKESRIKNRKQYYGFLMPFIYSRFFGILGIFRKALAWVLGCFKPITREVSEKEMYAVTHKSCALAAQTFMLAMASKGYDTCPLEGFDSKLVKRLLGLPRSASITMVIPCGVRAEGGVRTSQLRVPFEEIYKLL